MGFYSSHEGRMEFKNKEDLLKATEIIKGWIDPSYVEGKSFENNLELVWPDMFQVGDIGRNIHRAIDKICEEVPWTGILVGTSTDGCFDGWLIKNGSQVEYVDLEDWSKEHESDLYKEYQKYSKTVEKYDSGDESMSDDSYNEAWEKLSETRDEIENKYYETYL